MKYLAIPYTDPDPEIMRQRFELANKTAAELMKRGHLIYSPISHSHPIAQYGLPLDWEYWQHYDKEILSICDELIVIMAEGWKESKGVKAEMDMAVKQGITISFINPLTQPGDGQEQELRDSFSPPHKQRDPVADNNGVREGTIERHRQIP